MAMRQLRVYSEPDLSLRDFSVVEESADRGVQVTLGDILPLLADAVASNRTWLTDFADDEITITSDLHDVLQAYRHFRRPGA
jgi:hypothetical protein